MFLDGTVLRRDSVFSESDVDAFNGDNSSHFRGGKQACFYVEIATGDFIVREVFTEGRMADPAVGRQIVGKENLSQ